MYGVGPVPLKNVVAEVVDSRGRYLLKNVSRHGCMAVWLSPELHNRQWWSDERAAGTTYIYVVISEQWLM